MTAFCTLGNSQVFGAVLLLAVATGCSAGSATPVMLAAEIVAVRPHDPNAFTQGLEFRNERIWESTGLYGQSSVRKVDPATGSIIRKRRMPPEIFGEGLTWHNHELWMLTWREGTVFVMDPDTFETLRTYRYEGEGWGLATDGRHLIMSDGTSTLRFVNPVGFAVVRRLTVTDAGRPVNNLNELEFINGKLYANIFQTDRIARIHPKTGRVTGWLDLSSLRKHIPRPHRAEVLNGIAYDERTGHFLVTGKYWPVLFELRIREVPGK